MARHRRTLTRDTLLRRYAAATDMSVDQAVARHGDLDILALQRLVEAHEPASLGTRRSFARSLPTTTLQGQTR